MNPQQPENFYASQSGYPGAANRSPNSLRGGAGGGYGSAGLPSAFNTGRRNNQQQQQQQPLEPIGHSPIYGSDDRFNSIDAAPRYDRHGLAHQGQGTLPAAGFGNPSAWAFNNAATLSGPLYDGSRVGVGRNARRAALPPEWAGDSAYSHTGATQQFYPTSSPLLGFPNGGNDMFGAHGGGMGYQQTEFRAGHQMPQDINDVIATAIVIKNIPFNVRKEMLAQQMTDMNLPAPYAFNYHFDQGVFRGLAFANFNSPSDTKMVIDAMNGYEIAGRKLRVEYKKMLPEAERERIEREKREKRGQLEEQHRGPTHQISMSSLHSGSMPSRPTPGPERRIAVAVDMNDPETLKFYLQLFMFKGDDNQEALIFPNDTTPADRQLIHVLAHNMGLEHTSIGEGDNRQLHVSKSKVMMPPPTHQATGHLQQPGLNLDTHPRGLSRAATFDFAERSQHGPIHAGVRPTLAVPGSPDGHHGVSALRNIKSFADLRSFTPSPSPSIVSSGNHLAAPGLGAHGYGGHYMSENLLGAPGTPGGGISPVTGDPAGLVTSLGSLSLGTSAFDIGSSQLGGRPQATPGAIGSQRPGANGTRAIPDRQPRGPEPGWEASGGFVSRGRPNGHAQRGSDGSDSTGRIPGTAASLYQ